MLYHNNLPIITIRKHHTQTNHTLPNEQESFLSFLSLSLSRARTFTNYLRSKKSNPYHCRRKGSYKKQKAKSKKQKQTRIDRLGERDRKTPHNPSLFHSSSYSHTLLDDMSYQHINFSHLYARRIQWQICLRYAHFYTSII